MQWSFENQFIRPIADSKTDIAEQILQDFQRFQPDCVKFFRDFQEAKNIDCTSGLSRYPQEKRLTCDMQKAARNLPLSGQHQKG